MPSRHSQAPSRWKPSSLRSCIASCAVSCRCPRVPPRAAPRPARPSRCGWLASSRTHERTAHTRELPSRSRSPRPRDRRCTSSSGPPGLTAQGRAQGVGKALASRRHAHEREFVVPITENGVSGVAGWWVIEKPGHKKKGAHRLGTPPPLDPLHLTLLKERSGPRDPSESWCG